MFSNLTSYFFGGGGSPAPVTAANDGDNATPTTVDDKVVPTAEMKTSPSSTSEAVIVSTEMLTEKDVLVDEEDWLMVDSSSAGSEDEKMDDEAREELHPLRPTTVNSPSTVGVGMEESWIIAPTPTTLPCLVESAMEVSPMETLLIEHPSMSVYMKLDLPVRSPKSSQISAPEAATPLHVISPKPTSLSPEVPKLSSKPEAPTIVSGASTNLVQSNRSQTCKKDVVVKKSSNQKSRKQPHKPPQIPFILQQKAQKSKPLVPESPTTTALVKPKPALLSQKNKKTAKPEVVPNKLPKVKSKKLVAQPVVIRPLGEIQNVNPFQVNNKLDKSTKVAIKKKTSPPMNRIIESNIKEMYPTHVYPKDMRPFVEDFQNNGNARQHRELIASQRRSQLAVTHAKRQARRNPFNVESAEEMKNEAAMMEQKENLVEMRRQERFEYLLHSSQKQQQKRVDQSLRRNHLTRSNKVIHEMSARNKRQRRNDHSNKPSGANNNRKSQ